MHYDMAICMVFVVDILLQLFKSTSINDSNTESIIYIDEIGNDCVEYAGNNEGDKDTSKMRTPPPLTAAPGLGGLGPRSHHPLIFHQQHQQSRMSQFQSFSHLLPAESIYESAAKLLFMCIKWAKSVPSFLQLSEQDQTLLLEDSWSQLFIIGLAQWAVQFNEGTYILCYILVLLLFASKV
jgi:hypothetical protein